VNCKTQLRSPYLRCRKYGRPEGDPLQRTRERWTYPKSDPWTESWTGSSGVHSAEKPFTWQPAQKTGHLGVVRRGGVLTTRGVRIPRGVVRGVFPRGVVRGLRIQLAIDMDFRVVELEPLKREACFPQGSEGRRRLLSVEFRWRCAPRRRKSSIDTAG